MVVLDPCCRVLGRLRCLSECAEALIKSQPLPECVCFLPDEIEFKSKKSISLSIYMQPIKAGKKVELLFTSKHRIFLAAVEEKRNKEGRWMKIRKILESGNDVRLDSAFQWVLFSDDLVQVKPGQVSESENMNYWEEVVDRAYLLNPGVKNDMRIDPVDETAVAQFRDIPNGWTLKHDQALIQVFSGQTVEWTTKDFVSSIEGSENEGELQLIMDESSTESWYASESTAHFILTMKKNTVVRSMSVCFADESNPDSHLRIPKQVVVYGGEKGSEILLSTCKVDSSTMADSSITVLSGQCQHFPSLKLEFTDNGIGYGIRVTSLHFDGSVNGLDEPDTVRDICTKANQPLIGAFDPDFLCRRFMLLQRLTKLFDSVLMYMLPVWEYSIGSFDAFKVLQELLPLSKKRMKLVKTILRQTTDPERTHDIPLLYIKRNILNSAKLNADETVFGQIYAGLMKEEVSKDSGKTMTYRVSAEVTQWWKCIFIGEGIIDHGGGFRDTLSDIAEELCPSAADSALVLPFFIPCPNQRNGVASNYRDAYIPNPSCKEFHKYEWIGKLMGACLRSNENLAISLSPFFWRMLAGHEISWLEYMSVDEAQVLTVNEMERMDEDSYAACFGEMRSWTVVLSDGTSVSLKPNGEQLMVSYNERLKYVQMVKEVRTNETKQQIAAIRKGLLQVVPNAVLSLLTTNELEEKICGSPDISFEDLKKYVIISDSSLKSSESTKYFWKVLEDFSSNDRSQFLRFATGRRRLPTNVYIMSVYETDVLPSSSTCSHHFNLPTYTSFEKAKEFIHLAIYSSKFIDTDTAVVD